LPATLKHQVKSGFKRRDFQNIKQTFYRFASREASESQLRSNSEEAFISKDRFYDSLKELDVDVDVKQAENLFEEFDTDNSEGLNLQEFQTLLKKSNRLQEWAKSIPLTELLVDAIPRKVGVEPLRVVSTLNKDEIVAICKAVQDGLEILLQESSLLLRDAFQVNDTKGCADAESKFNLSVMSCGEVSDFFAGIQGRVGELVSAIICPICDLNFLNLIPSLQCVQVIQILNLKIPCRQNIVILLVLTMSSPH
jgi:hypothetical protein